MIVPPPPFPSLAARNRAFERVMEAIDGCRTRAALAADRGDYADDIARIRRDQAERAAEYGYDLFQAIQENLSAQAAHIHQLKEYHQCLSHRLPLRAY